MTDYIYIKYYVLLYLHNQSHIRVTGWVPNMQLGDQDLFAYIFPHKILYWKQGPILILKINFVNL